MKLRWPGDSQRESVRFARIKPYNRYARIKPYLIFITCERFARIASSLRFATFSPHEAQFVNKGFNSGTPKRFTRIKRFARICESIRANRASKVVKHTSANGRQKRECGQLNVKNRHVLIPQMDT